MPLRYCFTPYHDATTLIARLHTPFYAIDYHYVIFAYFSTCAAYADVAVSLRYADATTPRYYLPPRFRRCAIINMR